MRFREVWHDTFPPGWKAREHRHPDVWEIMVVTQGEVEIHTSAQHYRGMAGSVFIYSPQTLHWEEAVSAGELKMMGFYWQLARKGDAALLPDHLHDVHGRVGHTIQWMSELRDAFGSTLPVLDALTDAVVFECQRKPDALGEERMARVRSYIFQAGREALTVRKLAEVAHMSERHFTREFQRRTLLTPMTYVRKIRLEKASQAISQSDLPLRRIAHDVGFRDEFEFSRVFRRVMGYAPSTLRSKTHPALTPARPSVKKK